MQDEGEVPAIGVSGSQGVMIGPGGTQNNYYSPPGPNFLTTWNPHKSVTQLRGMPHGEAVSLLASAPVSDVTEVLKVMLQVDEALAVALVADVHPRTAEKLAETLKEQFSWLGALPDASANIARRAAELGWDRVPSAEYLERVSSDYLDDAMYFRKFGTRLIFWENSALIAVDEKIGEVYESYGGTDGILGVPITDEFHIPPCVIATRQNFDNGCIYATACGVYAVQQPIFGKYDSYGPGGAAVRASEWLGFPVASTQVLEGHVRQDFEKGTMCSSDVGVFPVRRAVAQVSLAISRGLFPLGDEADTPPSPKRTSGRVQRFDNVSGDELMVVYSTDKDEVQVVEGEVALAHDGLGGTGGWLGFPVSRLEQDFGRGWWQKFEGGTIYQLKSGACFAVPGRTAQHIKLMRAKELLGWPASPEYVLDGRSNIIQFFEGGAFALRNGRYEILVPWERPPALPGERPPRLRTADDIRRAREED